MTMTATANPSPDLADTGNSPASRLQAAMAAVRLSFTWMGIRKTLTADQKAQAASPFGAEGQSISAAKKLLDTKHPAFQAVTGVKTRITNLWKDMTLPYPEPGIRLIRRDHVDRFHERATLLREELEQAVTGLDRHYADLREAARGRLGDLYNPGDYPANLRGQFGVEWDYPSVEPASYLRDLNPELYEQERRRMVARFEEAVQLAEDAFAAELSKLVDHLVERLSGTVDGKPKTFHNSAVSNLEEFFQRFRSLNVGSSEQLDELVATAQRALRGVQPGQLRAKDDLRRRLATQLSAVGSQLEGLMVDRPRRRVMRTQAQGTAPVAGAGT
jgi:hypothetical protein